MDNIRFWVVVAVIVVGFIGISAFSNKDNASEGSSSASSKGSQNFYGKMDSPITVTEFVDFQCEACYAYYPVVKEVKEKYKDKVRFQVRHFPITSGHQFAMQGAKNAEAAAKQGKFWEMHDMIFEGQKIWEQSTDPQSYFDRYAKTIGLDMDKFKADRTSSVVNAIVNKDLSDVKELGGTGTPTFAINGKKIDNTAPSVEVLSRMIDNALTEAEKR